MEVQACACDPVTCCHVMLLFDLMKCTEHSIKNKRNQDICFAAGHAAPEASRGSPQGTETAPQGLEGRLP